MRRALLIGVGRYDGGYSGAITDAVMADLEAMRTLCSGRLGFTVESVLGLGREPVSKRMIEDALATLFRTAKDDDELLVYFSGHGRRVDGVDHLVPTDARSQHPLGRPQEDLVPVAFDPLRVASAARSVFVVVDACRDIDVDASQDAARPLAAAGDELQAPAAGQPLGYLVGTAPETRAWTARQGSIFTSALCALVPELDAGVRLRDAQERLQARVDEISTHEGLPHQRIEVTGNTAGLAAPFQLFETGVPSTAADVWSRALDALDDLPVSPAVVRLADELEHEAPDATTEADALWSSPPLPERLARAVAQLRCSAGLEQEELSLLAGVVAAVEAGLRRAETALERQSEAAAVQSVLAAAPRLREVLDQRTVQEEALWSWVRHLAAPAACIRNDCERLRADLARVVLAAFNSEQQASTSAADYLLQCVAVGFGGRTSADELTIEEWFGIDRRFVLRGTRLASLLELVWWCAMDTRLFAPDFGPQLLSESAGAAETLQALDAARWRDEGRVLQLDLVCPSAVLDHELRRVCQELSSRLLRETQPGRALAEVEDFPVAAVPSGLRPERGQRSYRLPHVTFTISTSDMHGLLMGSNFYGDEMLAVREAYQNAEDACRYRQRRDGGHGPSPEITVEVSEDDDGRLLLDCIDNGVGMSDLELRSAFARVGGRFRDLPEFLEEEAQREQHPGDVPPFQPISQFGIGVLSYFMVADRIELWTRRLRADRSYHEALHVDIASGGDLLRVRTTRSPEVPPASGTRLRFHLLEHITPERVLAALVATVRAPRVHVRWVDRTRSVEDRMWEPPLLYDFEGQVVAPCLPAMDLGVYLHPGRGAVLANGIAVGETPEQAYGFTISLDGRCRPELSVDRRTLRDFDRDMATELVCSAVAASASWADVSLDWLYELLRNHPRAGRAAYAVLQGRSLRLTLDEGTTTGAGKGRKTVEIRPDTDGILLEDATVLAGEPAAFVLGRVRTEAITQGMWAGSGLVPYTGLPVFDDRLAVLQRRQRVPLTVRELIELATELGVRGLGAVLVYAWAVATLDDVVTVTFRSEAVNLPEAGWPALKAAAGADRYTVLGSSSTPMWVDREYSVFSPRVTEVVSGLHAIDVDAAGRLSDEAVRLWSRDDDGINPFLTTWEDVVASLPRKRATPVSEEALAELAGVFRRPSPDLRSLLGSPQEPVSPFPVTDVDEGLTDALQHLLACDRDGAAPFYVERVPATHVARLADADGSAPMELASAVRAAGLSIVPDLVEPQDWQALSSLLERRPDVADLLVATEEGTFDLGPSLQPFAWQRAGGLQALVQFPTSASTAGLAGPRLRASRVRTSTSRNCDACPERWRRSRTSMWPSLCGWRSCCPRATSAHGACSSSCAPSRRAGGWRQCCRRSCADNPARVRPPTCRGLGWAARRPLPHSSSSAWRCWAQRRWRRSWSRCVRCSRSSPTATPTSPRSRLPLKFSRNPSSSTTCSSWGRSSSTRR